MEHTQREIVESAIQQIENQITEYRHFINNSSKRRCYVVAAGENLNQVIIKKFAKEPTWTEIEQGTTLKQIIKIIHFFPTREKALKTVEKYGKYNGMTYYMTAKRYFELMIELYEKAIFVLKNSLDQK